MKRIRKVVDLLITLMIPLVIAALMLGIARTFLDLRLILNSPGVGEAFDLMVTNILSTFVVVELLRSVLDYFELHRLKITYITDAAIVFVLREIMIGLFRHAMEARMIGALAALILVLGGIRTLAVVFSPEKGVEASHE